MRGVAIILVLLAAGACATFTSVEPVVFSGTLVDDLNRPVRDAIVLIEAFDNRDVVAGVPPPPAFRAETTTNADGQFEFRFGPPQALIPIAAGNGGLVSFMARAGIPEQDDDWSFNFVREIGREGWADSFTPIRWRPG
jgi:hypothetical protein